MRNNTQYIPVRLSHFLRHCSVGAIVRGSHYLMVVQDTRKWVNKNGEPAGQMIYYVEQIKRILEITQDLREPPIAVETEKGIEGAYVPATIFPSWSKCSACHLLYHKPWRQVDEKFSSIQCWKCHRGVVEQLPWVLAHEDGYLGDVHWHYIAHRDNKHPCASDWTNPYLTLLTHNGRMTIKCGRCQASQPFYRHDKMPFLQDQQPWLFEEKVAPSSKGDPVLAEVLEVSDTRVHSAITRSALVIPPESRVRRGSVIDKLYSSSEKRQRIQMAKTPFSKKSAIKCIATELFCRVDEVTQALMEIEQGYPLYGQVCTHTDLLQGEYTALTQQISALADDEDFVPHHLTEQWQALVQHVTPNSTSYKVGRLIDQVVSIARLKEIMVLMGFQRCGQGEEGEEKVTVAPDIEGQSSWLPALELYGEGVFFSLDETVLRQWERDEALIKRVSDFAKRYAAAGMQFSPDVTVTPRFMLLHALSHMLIRELERQSGYPSASLKERIYCSTTAEFPMAAILIYVAVADSVGSLGGLAELAAPNRLLPLLTRAFEHAQWCSLDPVCANHEGQGPGLLNRAACHGCLLIPETSCLYGNVLLDRLFLKGDSELGLPSILEIVS